MRAATGKVIPSRNIGGKMARNDTIAMKRRSVLKIRRRPGTDCIHPVIGYISLRVTIDNTALRATSSSSTAKTTSQLQRRRMKGLIAQLPTAIPSSTVESITVEAYMLELKNIARARDQT